MALLNSPGNQPNKCDEHGKLLAKSSARTAAQSADCKFCGRTIYLDEGVWTDREATGDDAIWGEVCDSNDSFDAHHEPAVVARRKTAEAVVFQRGGGVKDKNGRTGRMVEHFQFASGWMISVQWDDGGPFASGGPTWEDPESLTRNMDSWFQGSRTAQKGWVQIFYTMPGDTEERFVRTLGEGLNIALAKDSIQESGGTVTNIVDEDEGTTARRRQASAYDSPSGKPGSTATCGNCGGGLTAAGGTGTWLHDKTGYPQCPGSGMGFQGPSSGYTPDGQDVQELYAKPTNVMEWDDEAREYRSASLRRRHADIFTGPGGGNPDDFSANVSLCKNCHMPVFQSGADGLWYHDNTGANMCDLGLAGATLFAEPGGTIGAPQPGIDVASSRRTATKQTLARMLLAHFDSMQALRDANKNSGQFWFSPSTMAFFNSKVETDLINGEYFVTSEDNFDGTQRLFSIRRANPDASIDTVGEFQGYTSLNAATEALRRLPSTAALRKRAGTWGVDINGAFTEYADQAEAEAAAAAGGGTRWVATEWSEGPDSGQPRPGWRQVTRFLGGDGQYLSRRRTADAIDDAVVDAIHNNVRPDGLRAGAEAECGRCGGRLSLVLAYGGGNQGEWQWRWDHMVNGNPTNDYDHTGVPVNPRNWGASASRRVVADTPTQIVPLKSGNACGYCEKPAEFEVQAYGRPVGDACRAHVGDMAGNIAKAGRKQAADDESGYLGKKPFTDDQVGDRGPICGAKAKGAIGDCTRPPGHDSFHQGAAGYAFTDAFVSTSSRQASYEDRLLKFIAGEGPDPDTQDNASKIPSLEQAPAPAGDESQDPTSNPVAEQTHDHSGIPNPGSFDVDTLPTGGEGNATQGPVPVGSPIARLRRMAEEGGQTRHWYDQPSNDANKAFCGATDGLVRQTSTNVNCEACLSKMKAQGLGGVASKRPSIASLRKKADEDASTNPEKQNSAGDQPGEHWDANDIQQRWDTDGWGNDNPNAVPGTTGGLHDLRRRLASDFPPDRSDYDRGYGIAQADHAIGDVNLSDHEHTEQWQNASEEFKRGWSDGWEQAAQGNNSMKMLSPNASIKIDPSLAALVASGLTK